MANPGRTRLDLTTFSEATRRAIYEQVVADNFTTQFVEGQWWDPLYEPDQAEMQVLYLYGRRLVTWRKLEESPNAPEQEWRELLLVQPDPKSARGITFQEI